MDIFWLGNSTFKLKGKNATVLIDPPTGSKIVSEANIILFSDPAREFEVTGEARNFSGPGEYESKGVMVTGIANESGTVYQVTVDGLQIVHLSGSVALEGLEQTDILLTSAAGAVADLEPRMIIPYSDVEGLPKLIKELGGEGVEPLPKLTITKDKLPDEPTVVVLQHG